MKFRLYIYVKRKDGAASLFSAYVTSFDRTQKTPENLFG